jgi:hypothetical protein
VIRVGQIRLLARTFAARMFESDLMPDGLPQVQLVLWGALLAATPTAGYPLLLVKEYAGAGSLQSLASEFDADRVILITLSMIAIGVVGLVIWDGVFPDRRDVRVIGPLPVPTWRLVAARLAALGHVFVLFAIPVCVLQSVFFGLLVAGAGDPVPRAYGIAAHLLTVLCACTFVFCGLIAAQCLLLVFFGRRAAQGASVAFQVLFAMGLIQLVPFMSTIGRALRSGAGAGDGLAAVWALPPTWFLGLYEMLTGSGSPAAAAAARLALAATAASCVLAPGLYAASYRRLSRRALEGPPPRSGGTRAAVAAVMELNERLGTGSPVRTAIRQFAIRTLVRSRTHRMMFAVYAGVALAIVCSSGVSIALTDGGRQLWRPTLATLSMPLVLQFFLLIGIRVIIAVPSEPRARWVFRLCEPGQRAAAVSAALDVMTRLVVVPTTAFALLQGLALWTPWAAFCHAAFCFACGRVFSELLLTRTAKLPFACTYYPGTSRTFVLWPLYVFLFFFYSLGLAALDLTLMAAPAGLSMFLGMAAIGSAAIGAWRRRWLAGLPGLRFEEEEPGAMFRGFDLSEGLAAAPKAPRAVP